MSTSISAPIDPDQILQERADALAREPESRRDESAFVQAVEFTLAHEHYAIETRFVREVQPLEDLVPLPCTPPFVAGIVNIRGWILAVIDIKKFFDLPEEGIVDAHQILLVESRGVEAGILADLVTGVRSIPAESIQPVPPTLTGVRNEYSRGITPERMVILDAERILGDPRIMVREEVEG